MLNTVNRCRSAVNSAFQGRKSGRRAKKSLSAFILSFQNSGSNPGKIAKLIFTVPVYLTSFSSLQQALI
jgi:hypothetical protein